LENFFFEWHGEREVIEFRSALSYELLELSGANLNSLITSIYLKACEGGAM
jgi:hypothetical protein